MAEQEKVTAINSMMSGEAVDTSKLSVYLDFAKNEILNKMYAFDNKPDSVIDVPDKYNQVQIMAVVVGLTVAGAEGQNSHSENGIGRSFSYPTMVEYIHKHVMTVVDVI